MLLWLLIAILATLAGAALFSATRLAGRGERSDVDASEQHFKSQLNEIEQDFEAGRLSGEQADIARAELARELVAHRKQAQVDTNPNNGLNRLAVILPAAAAPICAVALYALVGAPNLPSQPLSGRPVQPAAEISFDEAIAQIEARLAETPDDLRGWEVLAPAYMRAGRYAEAETAFRRILELTEPRPDRLTDLAESRLMRNQGVADSETIDLLNQAVRLDPQYVRARFYLAGEATRAGLWEDAVKEWNELIALAGGDEPWLEVAQEGLAVAQARGQGTQGEEAAAPDQQEMIRGMVEQLSTRLAEQGGSLDEWTRLVRSYIVLGDLDAAADAYSEALAAYPEPQGREQLDELAGEAGLVSDERQ